MRGISFRVATTRTAAAAAGLGALVLGGATPAFGNLVTNPDFSSGNIGFSTEYSFSPGNIFGAGTYDIVTNPIVSHGLAASFFDHTTGSGLMMAVNGATAGEVVWEQSIPVDAATNYDFAVYIASWVPEFPAVLSVIINGATVGFLEAPASTGEWVLDFTSWNSGTSTLASVQLRDMTVESGGNDFALDDIYFGPPIFSQPPPVPSSPELQRLALALAIAGVAHLRLAARTRRR